MALTQKKLAPLLHNRAATRRLVPLTQKERPVSSRAMSLRSIESNEHSIRFQVLEEVSLTSVVEHILANADGVLSPEELSAGAGRARALELLQIGAVYVGIPHKGMDHINWVRSSDLPLAVTAATVPSGQYVRVHPRPKRYPACYCKDWPARVLHCDEDYVVINKPAGLPCMRHESNAAEELAACVGRALDMPGLEVCHRLDQWTTGVVVLSRNKEANRVFKRALQDREAGLIKTYKALTYSPVPLGPLEHHMYGGPFNEGVPVLGCENLRSRGPRMLSRTAHERWRLCRLEVKECREHAGALAWYRDHFPAHDEAFAVAPRALEAFRSQDPSLLRAGGGAASNPDHQQPQPPSESQQQGSRGHPGSMTPEPLTQPTPSLTAATALTIHAVAAQADAAELGALSSLSLSLSSPAAPAIQPCRLYESTVDLHTGRTHQIRAQLASLGCPLVGDTMYAPITGLLVGESGVLTDPATVSLVEGLPMLDRHVGLHAWRLSWRGRVFEAPPEWGPE